MSHECSLTTTTQRADEAFAGALLLRSICVIFALSCCWVQNATGAGLRVELPEIVIKAGWLEVEKDVQLEAYFPTVRIGGTNVSTANLCVRDGQFESLTEIPVWGERDRGEETERFIVGYTKRKISRFRMKQRCVVEVRDGCKSWLNEIVELPVTMKVDVFRSNARGGRALAYTRTYTIPNCE